jgi:hypothetical protein
VVSSSVKPADRGKGGVADRVRGISQQRPIRRNCRDPEFKVNKAGESGRSRDPELTTPRGADAHDQRFEPNFRSLPQGFSKQHYF